MSQQLEDNNKYMDKSKMVFINGFFSKDVPDNAPKFIMGKGSLHIGNLMQWLQENRYADFVNDGCINYEIRKSDKTGKRYIMVDTYKKPVAQPQAEGPETVDMQAEAAKINRQYSQEINPEGIPW